MTPIEIIGGAFMRRVPFTENQHFSSLAFFNFSFVSASTEIAFICIYVLFSRFEHFEFAALGGTVARAKVFSRRYRCVICNSNQRQASEFVSNRTESVLTRR
jgi:hypothetical protein